MEVTFKTRDDFFEVLLKLIQDNPHLLHYGRLEGHLAGGVWQEFTLSYGNDLEYRELAAFVGACFAVGLITKGEIVRV